MVILITPEQAKSNKAAQLVAEQIKSIGNTPAALRFPEKVKGVKFNLNVTDNEAVDYFNSSNQRVRFASVNDGVLSGCNHPVGELHSPPKQITKFKGDVTVFCVIPSKGVTEKVIERVISDARSQGHLVALFGFREPFGGIGVDIENAAATSREEIERDLTGRGYNLSNCLEVIVANVDGLIRHRPIKRVEQNKTRPLRAKEGVKIEVFAVAAIRDCAEEVNIFLNQARHLHPEKPVYLVTDELGDSFIEKRFKEDGGITIDVLPEAEIESLSRAVKTSDHGDRWSVAGIVCKYEALQRALNKHKKPALLCDSDLIFTERLPELSWRADLVLSTHQGASHFRNSPPIHGHFNAGLVLAGDSDIVKRWREMFEAGEGGFYEQKCLEKLSEEFLTDTFPDSWNWGGWRFHEDISKTGRLPEIAHCHIVGKWGEQGQSKSHKALRGHARRAVRSVDESRAAKDKIFFVHFPKAAGSSMMGMLKAEAKRLHFQLLDSWSLGLKRDWNDGELEMIASGRLWGQFSNYRYVAHNHAMNVSRASLEKFKSEGWHIVALYRNPRERLLSGYYWGQKKISSPQGFPFHEPFKPEMSLDEHVSTMLTNPLTRSQIDLVDGHELIDSWYMANDKGIESAVSEAFGCTPKKSTPHANTSQNMGYKNAVERGLLTSKTVSLIEGDAGIFKWDEFAESKGFDMIS